MDKTKLNFASCNQLNRDEKVDRFQMYTDDDSEWIPPSEAQLKVINARRERTDKISKRMSEYLLKGYKMLATSCNKVREE